MRVIGSVIVATAFVFSCHNSYAIAFPKINWEGLGTKIAEFFRPTKPKVPHNKPEQAPSTGVKPYYARPLADSARNQYFNDKNKNKEHGQTGDNRIRMLPPNSKDVYVKDKDGRIHQADTYICLMK